jgi:hypothetical protein
MQLAESQVDKMWPRHIKFSNQNCFFILESSSLVIALAVVIEKLPKTRLRPKKRKKKTDIRFFSFCR